MVLDNLQAWTLAAIREVVSQGTFESRLFDFKESLPTDDRGKARLRKTWQPSLTAPAGASSSSASRTTVGSRRMIALSGSTRAWMCPST